VDIAELARRERCGGVAFTYNEPIISAEYAIDVAAESHKRGLYTVAVTDGYITAAARAEFFGAMDAANVDLKGFTDEFTAATALRTCSRCSTRSSSWRTRPTYGSRSPRS